MKILVTGGSGFIGSNFILNLFKKNKDVEITNLDAEFYGSNPLNLSEIENIENYKFVKGNICDASLVDRLVFDCDAVVNFAA